MIIENLQLSKNIIDRRNISFIERIKGVYDNYGYEGVKAYFTGDYYPQGKKDKVKLISFLLLISVILISIIIYYKKFKK